MEAARATSRIVGVTVYRQGAQIRRIAEIAKGESTGGYPDAIRIVGLPLAMRDSSVRVTIEPANPGDSGRIPVAADIRVTLDIPDNDDEQAPPVDQELEAARRAVKALDGRMAQVKRELARVQRLTIAPRPKPGKGDSPAPPPESPTSSRLAMLALRESRERTLRSEMVELHEQYREAAREAKKLSERYKRATTARQAHEHELRKAVVVSLRPPLTDSGQGGEGGDDAPGQDGAHPYRAGSLASEVLAARANLEVQYMVPGARWAPAYSVRLGQGGEASFAMRAVVAQRTGEDWSGVALALSTANVQSWSELPDMPSIRIGRRQPRRRKAGWRPPPAGAEQLYGDYDRWVASSPPPGATPMVSIDEDSREITTRIKPYGVPGAGDFERRATLEYDRAEPTPEVSPYDDDESTGEVVMPPAPPAMPKPAPSYGAPPPGMQAMPARAKKRGGLFASFGNASRRERSTAEVPAYQMEEAARASTSDVLADESEFGATYDGDFDDGVVTRSGAGGGGGIQGFARTPPPEPEPALVAGAELLAYNDLRMPPPQSRIRGGLRPAGSAELYLELLVAQRVEVRFDVIAVVDAAMRRADAIGHSALPARCQPLRSDYYDYVYSADTVVDVPSDGSFHSIPLMARSADAKTRYVVVPRESTDVFRVAELENPIGSPILDGPIDVYLGKDFLLTSDASFTPPGGTLRLGLGVEQAVKVSRNTSFREETSGLMRGSLALKHEIRIEVQNHTGRTIDCEVRERVPARPEGNDDIDITVEDAKPSWESYEPDLAESPAEAHLEGGYRWRVEVPSGAKKPLKAEYTVKISSKYELIGGNRREV